MFNNKSFVSDASPSKPGRLRPLRAALGGLFTVGLGLAAQAQEAAPTAQEITAAVPEVRSELESVLLDYSKARFRNVRVVRYPARDYSHVGGKVSPSGLAFCGELNSPNAMGGMTGWKRFVTRPGFDPQAQTRTFVEQRSGDLSGSMVDLYCSGTVVAGPGDWSDAIAPPQPD